MIERTTVRLPSVLLDRARKKAAADGRTLTELIEQGLRLALKADQKAPKDEPVRYPRISSAKGWLLPDINLHAIQEMEDIEYVERMNRDFKD